MTTAPTPDPLTALAAELGRIGQRLDGMGVELMTLRDGMGAAGRPSPPEGRTVALRGEEAATSGHGGPARGGAPVARRRAGLSSWVCASGRARRRGRPSWAASARAGWRLPLRRRWPFSAAPAGLGPVPGWPQAAWAGQGLPPVGPPAGAPPAGPPPGTWGAAAPAVPKRSPLTGARLLAWTGGAVTLLGVVLLLALAASRGWFTPPARVAFGAVLGAGLVGLGMWLHRRESARAGALALVATGFATLYLVDAAATAIFDYLPALPALLLALVIAGAGLGLADRWRTQLLAGGVVVGAAVLAPALADGRLLVALVLVLQLAALLVVLRRRWVVLMLLAAAGPVLYGMYAVAVDESVLAVVGVAAAVLVVALSTAVLALRRIPATPASAPHLADYDGRSPAPAAAPAAAAGAPRDRAAAPAGAATDVPRDSTAGSRAERGRFG